MTTIMVNGGKIIMAENIYTEHIIGMIIHVIALSFQKIIGKKKEVGDRIN